MKSKNGILVPVFQLALGLLAVISFFAVMFNGEDIRQWILTLILAAVFIILGVFGIFGYAKD